MTWSISCTGAYNTPRLLELSGIGNPAILSQFNIPTVVDLPTVGENLQEHSYVVSDFIVKEGVFTLGELCFDINRPYALNIEQIDCEMILFTRRSRWKNSQALRSMVTLSC